MVEQAAERNQHKLAHAIVWTGCQPLISCHPASVPGAVGCLVARGRQCRPDGPSRPVSAAAGPEGDRDWRSRRGRRPQEITVLSAVWPDVATLRGSLSPSSKHPTSLRLITCRKSPPRALAAENGSCACASTANISPSKRPFDLCTRLREVRTTSTGRWSRLVGSRRGTRTCTGPQAGRRRPGAGRPSRPRR
jgi:hypothetical protein